MSGPYYNNSGAGNPNYGVPNGNFGLPNNPGNIIGGSGVLGPPNLSQPGLPNSSQVNPSYIQTILPSPNMGGQGLGLQVGNNFQVKPFNPVGNTGNPPQGPINNFMQSSPQYNPNLNRNPQGINNPSPGVPQFNPNLVGNSGGPFNLNNINTPNNLNPSNYPNTPVLKPFIQQGNLGPSPNIPNNYPPNNPQFNPGPSSNITNNYSPNNPQFNPGPSSNIPNTYSPNNPQFNPQTPNLLNNPTMSQNHSNNYALSNNLPNTYSSQGYSSTPYNGNPINLNQPNFVNPNTNNLGSGNMGSNNYQNRTLEYVWEWDCEDGLMKPYDQAINQLIESSYQQQITPQFQVMTDKGLKKYAIDFNKMEQVNIETNWRKRVTRKPKNSH